MSLIFAIQANALSSDGTISLTTYSMSKCGRYFAYVVSQSVSVYNFGRKRRVVYIFQKGSDFVTVYIRHTDSPFTKGTDHDNDPGRLSEVIKYVKFSNIAWSPDSLGFFYQV